MTPAIHVLNMTYTTMLNWPVHLSPLKGAKFCWIKLGLLMILL